MYARYDEDPMAGLEAILNQRHEADLEQAELEAAGGGLSYIKPPVHPEQAGLKPGEMRCATCKTVVPDLLAEVHTG
ncbi:MAG TPA: hypothetical protein VGP70_28635 [Actinomadura sp.]|jgi:hypothetical protein|nr:hypothetical protein [Actinomadura sp.]